jgi:hypothetical protein
MNEGAYNPVSVMQLAKYGKRLASHAVVALLNEKSVAP